MFPMKNLTEECNQMRIQLFSIQKDDKSLHIFGCDHSREASPIESCFGGSYIFSCSDYGVDDGGQGGPYMRTVWSAKRFQLFGLRKRTRE